MFFLKRLKKINKLRILVGACPRLVTETSEIQSGSCHSALRFTSVASLLHAFGSMLSITHAMQKYSYFSRVLILCFGFVFSNVKAQSSLFLEKIESELVCTISHSLRESSGLIIYNQQFYSINDSGNLPYLFSFDSKTGAILDSNLIDVKNIDWEELTQSKDAIFIGDFGDNKQRRDTVFIYKVNKKDLAQRKISVQTIKIGMPRKHNMEAMTYINNEIHLFTKSAKNDPYTFHYKLNDAIGFIKPELIDSFMIEGQVTGACNYGSSVLLIGYKPPLFNSFIYLYERGKELKKLSLGSAFEIGQVEAIYYEKPYIYFTRESHRKLVQKAALFRIDMEILDSFLNKN